MTNQKAARVYEVGKRLAFLNSNMDVSKPEDHEAFERYWNALMQYMGQDGEELLYALSPGLIDVEIGYVILNMTRAMVAKRNGKIEEDGLRVITKAVVNTSLQVCSAAEISMANQLKDQQPTEEDDVPLMSNRMKSATTEGNIIYLTEIFKVRTPTR